MKYVEILNCKFSNWSTDEALDRIEILVNADRRDFMCTVNVSILMMMRNDERLRNFVGKSGMVVPDGQPIIWASRFIRQPLKERVTGVELVPRIAEIGAKNDWGVYLLGATQAIVGEVKNRLEHQYPTLQVSGCADGFFALDDAGDRVKAIRESGAKILIVAMGVPRQEYFLDDNWENLGVNFAIGVGGSFDVIAGMTKRAPAWMQKSGLEWLYRMLQEPGRLFMRYLVTNSQFIHLFFKEIAPMRKSSGKKKDYHAN